MSDAYIFGKDNSISYLPKDFLSNKFVIYPDQVLKDFTIKKISKFAIKDSLINRENQTLFQMINDTSKITLAVDYANYLQYTNIILVGYDFGILETVKNYNKQVFKKVYDYLCEYRKYINIVTLVPFLDLMLENKQFENIIGQEND